MRVFASLTVLLLGLPTGGPDPHMGLSAGRARPAVLSGGEVADVPTGKGATLDLKSLEQRLRETKVIGLFTKLSLKNQVDDLVERFRAFHNGTKGMTIADLRERYNLLLLKVLSLLQDDDPSLFRDISASRQALWDLLADPNKFKTLSKEAKS